jgi:hypothetical protein
VAKSFFNDNYILFLNNSNVITRVPINENNIAWESDIEYKFGNVPNQTLPDGTVQTW